MLKNDEHFSEEHSVESDDHVANNLSSTREFSTSEAVVVRQEQPPSSDSSPVVHSSDRESHCATGFSTSKLPSCEPPLLQPLLHYMSSVFNLEDFDLWTETHKSMLILLIVLFLSVDIAAGAHFNGGTIRWEPITPNVNSSIVPINIIQTYSWTYPLISCATDVPISTPGRNSGNGTLTCVTDCSTDGNYSANPVSILTDCQSVSISLGMLTSERSVNVNLTAGAHFYLANVGSAWISLDDPPQSNLQWSIVCFVDLRLRPDGIINTPPVASFVSPQYAIVNRTTQITIPVSDANVGDDVRCRWSVYTSGNRRRRDIDDHQFHNQYYDRRIDNKELIHSREKKGADPCKHCSSVCANKCPCSCPGCTGAICTGKCNIGSGCPIGTTTVDTPGPLASTSSYPNRQPIDECGGICHLNSLPNDTTLSGCTITFTGLVPDRWYGVAIQVEDFIDNTSNVSMSSVPVQFLIYVMAQPMCGLAPVIFPLTGCLDVQLGVLNSFNLSALTLCDPTVSDIASITVVNAIAGMTVSNTTTTSPINISISYVTFTWIPQPNQLGSQKLCVVASTEEQIQSQTYCVTFNVISSSNLCITTTATTTTTTTSVTTMTTSTSTTSTTTTVTTKAKDPAKGINWPLIVGLSLLALLLALCGSCCCLYWLLWGPAARRRRRRRAQEKTQRDSIIPRVTLNKPRQRHLILRIMGLDKKHSYYDALHNSRLSVRNVSPLDPPLDLVDPLALRSAFTTSNRDKTPKVSTEPSKHNQSVTVTRLSANEKPLKTVNKGIKPSNQIDVTRRSIVSVTKVNNSAKLDEVNEKSPQLSEDDVKTSSTPAPTATNPVTVTRVPRHSARVAQLQQQRPASVTSVNVIHVDGSAAKTSSLNDQVDSPSMLRHLKKTTTGRVTVIKLPRSSAIN